MKKKILILLLLVSLLATFVSSEVTKSDSDSIEEPDNNFESSEVPDGYVHKRALSKLLLLDAYIKTKGG